MHNNALPGNLFVISIDSVRLILKPSAMLIRFSPIFLINIVKIKDVWHYWILIFPGQRQGFYDSI